MLRCPPPHAMHPLSGYKVISTFLTNNAEDLEPASLLLEWLHTQARPAQCHVTAHPHYHNHMSVPLCQAYMHISTCLARQYPMQTRHM